MFCHCWFARFLDADEMFLLQGTLPLRLLAAEYGADITYGEEIIDHKLLKCERRLNGISVFICIFCLVQLTVYLSSFSSC